MRCIITESQSDDLFSKLLKRHNITYNILYLNDNDGCTEFPNLGIKVNPKAGRLLIFPPLWMYPHQGLPPTNNDKYIMMTYLHHTNKE